MFKMELINNMIGIFAMKMEFIQKCQYAIVAVTVIQCFNDSNTMLWKVTQCYGTAYFVEKSTCIKCTHHLARSISKAPLKFAEVKSSVFQVNEGIIYDRVYFRLVELNKFV